MLHEMLRNPEIGHRTFGSQFRPDVSVLGWKLVHLAEGKRGLLLLLLSLIRFWLSAPLIEEGPVT